MAVEIVYGTAQDEVCVEIWEVLQAVKKRALGYLADGKHHQEYALEVNDMINLMDVASSVYRHQAEEAPDTGTTKLAKAANPDKTEHVSVPSVRLVSSNSVSSGNTAFFSSP